MKAGHAITSVPQVLKLVDGMLDERRQAHWSHALSLTLNGSLEEEGYCCQDPHQGFLPCGGCCISHRMICRSLRFEAL